jgi:hypothetical protein
MKRTTEEINRQVEGIENMKKRLPAVSKIGTANHKMFDAQLNVLQEVEHPDEINEDFFDDFEQFLDVHGAAWEAQEWMDGDSNDDLFE